MTDQTKARTALMGLHRQICFENGDHPDEVDTVYSTGADAITRADISDAKDKRITELEAKLAKATDGLRECEEEIDDYVRQEYPGEHPVQARYRERDFAANPARKTLAELKGTDQ